MVRSIVALLVVLTSTAAQAQGMRGPPPDARPPGAAPEPSGQENAPAPDQRADVRGGTLPRGAVLEEVSGVVHDVDRKAHTIAVEAGGQHLTLSLDRNTMVYTPTGLGTVLDVVPGAQIRAGRNADFLAYWVQIRAPTRPATPSTPGQGTGPAGGAAAPATEAGGAAAPGEAGSAGTPPAPGVSPGAGPSVAPGG